MTNPNQNPPPTDGQNLRRYDDEIQQILQRTERLGFYQV
jgi:hypothetical protein